MANEELEGLSTDIYSYYQVTGRFPISITVTNYPEKILIDISTLDELIKFVENTQMAIKEIFEDFFLKPN